MHILFVLEHYFPYIGGAEKLFKNLAESLVKRGFKVTVATTRHQTTLRSHEMINGVEIVRLPFSNRFSFTFFSFPYLLKYIRACDIVHTTSYNAALPAFFAGKLCRKPIYITFHEVWDRLWLSLPFYNHFQKISFYCFEKWILLLPFNKYIAVSEFTKESLINAGIPATKIIRIYNGVDYEKLEKHDQPIHSTISEFSYYGRLGASKGLDILLDAMHLLKQANFHFMCQLIIPKYPNVVYDKVLKLIEDYELNEHITIFHELSEAELYQRIQSSSFVVIPSRSEGFCFVAAECSALHIPVVSSGKGALPETVSGRYIQLDELDAVHLKDAIERAFRQEWQEKEIHRFTIEDMIRNYGEIYI
jgi:glycosyltransferase involved in cell wall biosynthesis